MTTVDGATRFYRACYQLVEGFRKCHLRDPLAGFSLFAGVLWLLGGGGDLQIVKTS